MGEDELVGNLAGALSQCTPEIQQRMIGMLKQCDADYGTRVEEGIKMKMSMKEPVGSMK